MKPWRGAELAQLRSLYPDKPAKDLARSLKRPLHQIYVKAGELGLRKSAAFLAGPHSGRLSSTRCCINGNKPWTPAALAKLRKLYPDTRAADLVKALKHPLVSIYGKATQLGLKKSPAFLASTASGRLDGVRGSKTRFQKGNVPWTKGKKGLDCGGKATQFRKGHTAHNRVPVGTVVMATIGYLKVKVAEPKKWRWVHRMVWEEMKGPIPKGMMLVFKDRNAENVEPDNLELITREEHMRRHTIANYPPELRDAMRLVRKINTTIEERREKQD